MSEETSQTEVVERKYISPFNHVGSVVFFATAHSVFGYLFPLTTPQQVVINSDNIPNRLKKFTIPVTIAYLTYSFAHAAASEFRAKNDLWSHSIAGMVTGAFCGIAKQSPRHFIDRAVTHGILGMSLAIAINVVARDFPRAFSDVEETKKFRNVLNIPDFKVPEKKF